MEFYFDDSGDFLLPRGDSHKISLWLGILIPETCIKRVGTGFIEWEKKLPKSNKKGNEAKGKLLNEAGRDQFFAIIDSESDLLFQPSIIDLQVQKKFAPTNLPEILRDEQIAEANQVKVDELREKVLLHARRIGNLSTEQVLKSFCLINCVMQTIRHSILFRCDGPFRECWKTVKMRIDRSGKEVGSREDMVSKETLPYFLFNRSRKRPFEMTAEIQTNHHAFVRAYDSPQGINIFKLCRDLSFKDSSRHWGIRFADVVANTLFCAISDIDNTRGFLRYYSKVMKHSILGPRSDLGFTLIAGEEKSSPIRLPRYKILQEILARRS